MTRSAASLIPKSDDVNALLVMAHPHRLSKAVARHMKKLIVGSVLVAFSAGAMAQGVLLDQGQSYIFEFKSLTDLRPAVAGDPCQVIAWFAPGTLDPPGGEKAILEIFPDSLLDSPFSSTITIDEFSSGRGALIYGGLCGGPHPEPPLFPDLQGVLRVTMLSGSAQLTGFEVSQVINGEFYSDYTTVPEPAASTLLAAGLVCLLLFRIKTRTTNERTSGNGATALLFPAERLRRAVPECECWTTPK